MSLLGVTPPSQPSSAELMEKRLECKKDLRFWKANGSNPVNVSNHTKGEIQPDWWPPELRGLLVVSLDPFWWPS